MSLEEFGQWFWHDEFWLPPNVTWEQFKNTGNGNERYATSSDLLYPIPLALVLLLVRFLVENQVFRPIGRHLGIKEVKRKHPGHNEMLEKAFQKPKTGHEEIVKLAKQLDMTERSIELWFRQRALFSKPSQLDKFAETGWRWTYYTSIFLWGLTSLWSKTWFWNIRDCWYKYPYHIVDSDIWWWYMAELGFYWGLLVTQFFDVKRKDFMMMFVHHGATILLMSFSWTCNFFKVGTLVLIIHDVADIFLESAKLCKYGGAKKVSEILFGSFALSWFITRLGIFPTWIIYSVTVEAPQLIQYFPAYFAFNALLSLLLLLNILWAYYILKAVYQAFMAQDSIAKDIRSDEDSDLEIDVEPESKQNGIMVDDKKSQ